VSNTWAGGEPGSTRAATRWWDYQRSTADNSLARVPCRSAFTVSLREKNGHLSISITSPACVCWWAWTSPASNLWACMAQDRLEKGSPTTHPAKDPFSSCRRIRQRPRYPENAPPVPPTPAPTVSARRPPAGPADCPVTSLCHLCRWWCRTHGSTRATRWAGSRSSTPSTCPSGTGCPWAEGLGCCTRSWAQFMVTVTSAQCLGGLARVHTSMFSPHTTPKAAA